MLIEGKPLIGQLLQRNQAGAEAFSSIGLQHSHFGHRHFRKNSSSLGTLKDSNGGSMWLGAGGRSSQVPHTQSRGSPPVYSSATGQSNFSRAAAVLRPHNRLWTLGLIPRPGRPCWLSPLSISFGGPHFLPFASASVKFRRFFLRLCVFWLRGWFCMAG